MSTEPYNEPAFPIQGPVADHQFSGMTLRDYFAAKSLPSALIVCQHDAREPGTSYIDHCAGMAYTVADAMLKARQS